MKLEVFRCEKIGNKGVKETQFDLSLNGSDIQETLLDRLHESISIWRKERSFPSQEMVVCDNGYCSPLLKSNIVEVYIHLEPTTRISSNKHQYSLSFLSRFFSIFLSYEMYNQAD